jgi:16S rRNA (uracil1498-N3)-methyltransferase
MRNIRIYHDGTFEINDILELNETASHHLKNVLRQKLGNIITIFSHNVEYQAELIDFKKKVIVVRVLNKDFITREDQHPFTLVIGMPKHDTMDFIIQKATELGVANIIPITTEYSNINLSKLNIEKKIAQWRAISISAAEQAMRNTIPTIQNPIHFKEFTAQNMFNNYLVMHPYTNNSLFSIMNNKNKIKKTIQGIFIGPEGGFSNKEITTLEHLDITQATLGKKILRVETATIATIAIIQAFQEELC